MNGNVKVKRILTRTNRGIVLGIVLLILLVSFVVIDGVIFRADTKNIRTDIVDCITKTAELNSLLDPERVGERIGNEDRAEMEAGLNAIFETYYADPFLGSQITVYDGYDSTETMEELALWFDRTATMEVTDVRVLDTREEFQITFERQGYRFARVQINDLPMEMDLRTAVLSPEPFLGGGPSYLIDRIEPDGSPVFGKNKTLKFFLSGSVYLAKTDGEWKILMSDFYTKTTTEVE